MTTIVNKDKNEYNKNNKNEAAAATTTAATMITTIKKYYNDRIGKTVISATLPSPKIRK